MLRRHPGGTLELRVNGVFVMDTAHTNTERFLAESALSAVGHPRRVFVGGLGLGYTLDAVLLHPGVEQVDVVEIEPAVVAWMTDGTVPHGPTLLRDPRVRLTTGDARAYLDEITHTYAAVLLDVDNGPAYLVHDANEPVYAAPFLRRCVARLAPGGVLAVWSSTSSPELERTLRAVAGSCAVRRLPVDLDGRDEAYTVFIAPDPASSALGRSLPA